MKRAASVFRKKWGPSDCRSVIEDNGSHKRLFSAPRKMNGGSDTPAIRMYDRSHVSAG
jgi:hypothetical protein